MRKLPLPIAVLALTAGLGFCVGTAPDEPRSDAKITVVECSYPATGLGCSTVVMWTSGVVAMREGIWGQVGQAIKARPTSGGSWE